MSPNPCIDGAARDGRACVAPCDAIFGVDRLRAAADSASIKVQWGASGRGTGTDANAIQLARGGVAAGLVSVPNRYMHSPNEMVDTRDLQAAASLIAHFCRDLKAGEDFVHR